MLPELTGQDRGILSTLPSFNNPSKTFEIDLVGGVWRLLCAPDRGLLWKSICSSHQPQDYHFLLLLHSCTVEDHISSSVKLTLM